MKLSDLTDKPVTAVATHIHWDHIGGHVFFPDFYAHEAELNWLDGRIPSDNRANLKTWLLTAVICL